jgi:TolB protein
MIKGMVSKREWAKAAVLAGLISVGWLSAADSTISITATYQHDPTKPTPISISGFTAEVRRILTFDLEVAGCAVVPADQAAYRVSGKYSGKLEGYLQAGNKYLLSKAFTGASTRMLAHAFADEVALAINKVPGVARTRVAFKNRSRRSGEILVADYDGHGAVQLTRDGSIIAAPAWGNRNSRLYYTSYLRGNPDIYVQEYATGKRRTIVRLPGSNLTPVPSPDGTKIAMVLSISGSPNLYVTDANGGNRRQLSHTKAGVSTPTWSPDGRSICYVSRESGPARLFRISVNGGRAQRIPTVGVYNCTEPDWSPDGKTIAFTTQRGGFTICTVPAGGGQVTQLTSGEDPSWAPNSRTLMFVKRRADQSSYLRLLDVPTKQVKDVPLSLGNVSQPAWAR